MTAEIAQDAQGRRSIAFELEVPGTPEQVWHAIATGPGITSWFTTTDVEEREGGAVAFQMGEGMESSGRVTQWNPPARFAYEEPDWSPPAPPLATEFTIEARPAGTCIVRLVHSLSASSDDWDDQLKAFEIGWAPHFDVLRLYLAHFVGQRGVNVRIMSRSASPEAETWATLIRVLGLAGATKYKRLTVSAPGAPALAGTVERIGEASHPHEAIVRMDEPAPGAALIAACTWGGSAHAMMSLFLYGERAEAISAHVEKSWRTWMNGLFPATAPGAVSNAATE